MRVRRPATEEHREEQDIADDADRPRPHPSPHAADGGGEPEQIAEDLAVVDRVAADVPLCCVEPVDGTHESAFTLANPSNRSAYFAITSTSRFTLSPTAFAPSVVRASVVGIRLTVNDYVPDRGNRQGHAVDGDRALLDDVARE